jgi:hypothetical protein
VISDHLPSVLQDPRGSISMERALKQIRDLILEYAVVATKDFESDRINASLDDIETMLKHLK